MALLPAPAKAWITRSGSAVGAFTSGPFNLQCFASSLVLKAEWSTKAPRSSLAGGARAAQQYLAAGLVDEMEINVVPTLLGSGERLFDGVGDNLHGLDLVRTIAAPTVTHLKFVRR